MSNIPKETWKVQRAEGWLSDSDIRDYSPVEIVKALNFPLIFIIYTFTGSLII